MKKSQFVQFLLTLLLGPLGLIYSNVKAMIILIVAAIFIGVGTAGIGAILIWPVSIIAGFPLVTHYNERIDFIANKNA